MGMTRGTALVATALRVTQLTGIQFLANLEAGAGITLTDLLTTASDAIYDQLDREGESPADLDNEEVYEKAVAWHFLAILVLGGYIKLPPGLDPPKNTDGQADPYAWSDVHLRRVRPSYPTSADQNPTAAAGERFGSVGNVSSTPLYGEDFR
jgi:hypothetical protein